MKNIGILLHENYSAKDVKSYYIYYLAKIWHRMDFNVYLLKGLSKDCPSIDLLIVHIDLSVVPRSYLEYAKQFSVVLNGNIQDIRKSTISKNLVKSSDSYNGRVIVKSNLNNSGLTESVYLGRTNSVLTNPDRKCTPKGYRVYDCYDQVPDEYLTNPDWVVEKFLPEIEDGLYHIRFYSFLGDRWICARRCSSNPILTGATCLEKREIIDPHPELLKIRSQLGFDYGKFDYVVHDDKVIIIDANKTIGGGKQFLTQNSSSIKSLEYLAEGIKYYF